MICTDLSVSFSMSSFDLDSLASWGDSINIPLETVQRKAVANSPHDVDTKMDSIRGTLEVYVEHLKAKIQFKQVQTRILWFLILLLICSICFDNSRY